MDYKEICNKQINELSSELLNNGMPVYDILSMTLEIYEVIEKHLEEENNEVN